MGSQQILPIRFEFVRLPVRWTAMGNALIGRMERGRPDTSTLRNLDGWHCRDEFFELPIGDVDRLTVFLNDVGAWPGGGEPNQNTPGDALRFPLSINAEDVWAFRDDLKDALQNREAFKKALGPFPRNRTFLDLAGPLPVEIKQTAGPIFSVPANSFQLRLELSKVAAGVVTITNARHMLIATVIADVARGIKFGICKRKDCRIPFAIKDGRARKKKYHDDQCQHLALVQRGRRPNKKGKA